MNSKKNHKLRVLFILSNFLGNSFYSEKIREAVDDWDFIDKVYLYINPEDYTNFSIPKLVRKSSTFTVAWIAKEKFKKTINNKKFNCIFYNTWEPMVGLYKILKNIPSVLVCDLTPKLAFRNLELQMMIDSNINFKSQALSLIKRYILNQKYKIMLKQANFFLPWGKWCADSLEKDYGINKVNTEILPCPIDLNIWKPSNGYLSNEKPILLFVGNDFKRKGGDFLLNLYRSWLTSYCKLRIISNDSYLKTCSLPKDVELVMGLSHNNLNEIISFYRLSDIFVYPTKRDSFGIVLAEAVSIGLPVITTNHLHGVRELIEDGFNGYLLPYGNEKLWAKKIKELLDNKEIRLKMGQNARKIALEKFSEGKFKSKVLETIEKVLNG